MKLFVVMRRASWTHPSDLEAAAARARATEQAGTHDVRWIRTYVVDEGGGKIGTVCVYQAPSAEAVWAQAKDAQLPVDEVLPVSDTVVVRADPAEVPAAAPQAPRDPLYYSG